MNHILNNDVLMNIFGYCPPNIISMLSKYWHSRRHHLADFFYQYKLGNIKTDYNLNQINTTYEAITIHEYYDVGQYNDLINPINDIYRHDYNTIGFCCLRTKIKKLYNYKTINYKNPIIKSLCKDKYCMGIIGCYLLTFLLLLSLLLYSIIDVNNDPIHYINRYINNLTITDDQYNNLKLPFTERDIIFIANCYDRSINYTFILDILINNSKNYGIDRYILNPILKSLFELCYNKTINSFVYNIFWIQRQENWYGYWSEANKYYIGKFNIDLYNIHCIKFTADVSDLDYNYLITNELIIYTISIILLSILMFFHCNSIK